MAVPERTGFSVGEGEAGISVVVGGALGDPAGPGALSAQRLGDLLRRQDLAERFHRWLLLPGIRSIAMTIIPRDRDDPFFRDFDHPEFLKGLEGPPDRIERPVENGGQHFFRQGNPVRKDERTAPPGFSRLAENLEPDRQKGVPIRQRIDEFDFLVVEDGCDYLDPGHGGHHFSPDRFPRRTGLSKPLTERDLFRRSPIGRWEVMRRPP